MLRLAAALTTRLTLQLTGPFEVSTVWTLRFAFKLKLLLCTGSNRDNTFVFFGVQALTELPVP